MSKTIKKCPACGQANGADEFFCRNCSADISAVETTAEDTDLKSTRQGKETAGQSKDGDILGREGTVASQIFAGRKVLTGSNRKG